MSRRSEYSSMDDRKWWTPKPGEPWNLRVVSNWPPPADYAAIETHIILTAPWNTPHVCTHEGPWTLHSCNECDYNEARALVALFAWLAGDKKTLDLIRPQPMVHCLHADATRYAPCPRCREQIYLGGVTVDGRLTPAAAWLRRNGRNDGKRANFGAALGPYGMPHPQHIKYTLPGIAYGRIAR